jgi:uncharacterized phiE125 gp8 family phage protein
VVLKSGCSWPTDVLQEVNGIVIQFTCGYGDDAADVPETIKAAMKIWIGCRYENRESEDIPDAVKNLLNMDRVMQI